MNQIASAAVSPLLDHCPESLPAAWYYDTAHHARELKSIWLRQWVYVGRSSDLPAFNVRKFDIGGQNLILVKDAAGTVSCFHNTCRHRGAELCQAQDTRLKAKLITCPYHEWAYDLQGRLVRVPYASPTPDFRKEDHGLLKVHLKEWNGFHFVSLADDPPPFDAAPDLGTDALDNWPMRDLVTGHVMVKEIACNWKVFWENYNECLHCPGIHPELCDLVPVYNKGLMAPNEAADWTPDAQADAGPLKSGARTWTMTGKPCGPEFPGLSTAQRLAGHTFVTLWPTMYVVAHVDYVRAVSLKPLGPERTELRAEWLFPRATLEAPGFDLDNVTGFASLVIVQDGEASEINQRGLKSMAFKAGRLMPQEFDVYRFQQWVRAQLT
ncbi:aromatic ring-hydroxylating dioxygenase subunit alpha [Aestuariivirga sp.]|uniref:aromatic ring-hydroxylating oxygenase subunit alpha n=1 Tax=Aestuariivirga sp. TaxID=2650926 RepID=UPI003593D6DF